MKTATEILTRVSHFDSYFKVWINASRHEGFTDEQIVDDLRRIVRMVEVEKEKTKKVRDLSWRKIDMLDLDEVQEKIGIPAFRKSSYTRVARMAAANYFNNLGEMYDAGPAVWVLEPYIGLKVVNCASAIINHYAGEELIPSFQSISSATNFVPEEL